MLHAIPLVCDDGGEIHVLDAFENVLLDIRIDLLQGADQLLDLHALGVRVALGVNGGAGVGKMAGTLDEVQAIGITPQLDIVLADQVERADQLHAPEVRRMQLRHHGLDLATIEHAHEDGLDHIIIVVSESNLVAAELPGLRIQVATAHTCTQIAWILRYGIYNVKDIRIKHRKRHIEKACIFLDDSEIRVVISRIHAHEGQIEIELVMTLYLLEELGHEKRILAARYAHSHMVAGLQELVGVECLGEFREKTLVIGLSDAFLNLLFL